MKIGDIVRVKTREGAHHHHDTRWWGLVGVIIAEAKRIHVPSFKVLLGGEIIEFDYDEIELVT
tara:strand:+ start:1657 stop:1845 length:189 start_codon:yes stop_codon:yes gene_type:complete